MQLRLCDLITDEAVRRVATFFQSMTFKSEVCPEDGALLWNGMLAVVENIPRQNSHNVLVPNKLANIHCLKSNTVANMPHANFNLIR